MSRFDRSHLRTLGFEGFAPLRSQPRGCPDVPHDAGVYAVVRDANVPVRFLTTSVGGHFKHRDPSVPVAALVEKWVDGTDTIYLGRADKLRWRIDQFARFGRGEPIGHGGGCYIWQLADHDSLEVAWLVDAEPRAREAQLIKEFVAATGQLPFANLNRPRAGASGS